MNDGLPVPLTSQAETITGVWWTFLLIAVGVVALVVALVLYVSVRGVRNRNRMPDQSHYNIPVEIAYTVIPLLLVVGLFVLTVRSLDEVQAADAEPDLVLDVTAFQWQWEFEYVDRNVVIRSADGEAEPEILLPAGQTVRFDLSSRDVIHSFWVPGFLYKHDMIPGRPASFQVDLLDQPGQTSQGECAEFCGVYHARMGFVVRIVDEAEFDRWLAQNETLTDATPATEGAAAADDEETNP